MLGNFTVRLFPLAYAQSQLSSLTSCSGRAQLVRCKRRSDDSVPFPEGLGIAWKITAATAMSGLARLPKIFKGTQDQAHETCYCRLPFLQTFCLSF